MLRDIEDEINREAKKPLMLRGNPTKDQLQNFLRGKVSDEVDLEQVTNGQKSKPIADLFPEAVCETQETRQPHARLEDF
jgi:hypothetical protein